MNYDQKVNELYGEISVQQTQALLLIADMQAHGVSNETIAKFEHHVVFEAALRQELRALQEKNIGRRLLGIIRPRLH